MKKKLKITNFYYLSCYFIFYLKYTYIHIYNLNYTMNKNLDDFLISAIDIPKKNDRYN